jgi:hypothetical protein
VIMQTSSFGASGMFSSSLSSQRSIQTRYLTRRQLCWEAAIVFHIGHHLVRESAHGDD